MIWIKKHHVGGWYWRLMAFQYARPCHPHGRNYKIYACKRQWRWLVNYLSGRQAFVEFVSNYRKIRMGVFQERVLSLSAWINIKSVKKRNLYLSTFKFTATLLTLWRFNYFKKLRYLMVSKKLWFNTCGTIQSHWSFKINQTCHSLHVTCLVGKSWNILFHPNVEELIQLFG